MLDVKEQVDSKAWYLILAHQRMYEDKVLYPTGQSCTYK